MNKLLKKGGIVLLGIIVSCVFVGCKEEAPMSVIINAGQLEIKGTTAHVIHADTTGIVITRDSLPVDEKHEELYHVKTIIQLVLDSLFITDCLEDSLKLQFTNAEGKELATLVPSDSTIVDSLIVYLKKEVGKGINIVFEGEMNRDVLLQLKKEPKIAFTGFSFPFADPKVTANVDKLGRAVGTLKEMYRDLKNSSQGGYNAFNNMFAAMIFVKGLENINALDKEIAGLKSQMTPIQLAKYESYHQELQMLNDKSK